MPDNERRKKSWDDRYRSSSKQPLIPEPFLVEHISFFKPGSVLDLACGEGRNSMFLSQYGLQVSSFDFSKIALARLSEISYKGHLNIKTIKLDLSREADIKLLTKADNITVVHYKLSDDLLNLIPSLLHKNGIFLYCTFNLRQLEIRAFPEKFCLKHEELVDKKWELKLLKHSTFRNRKGYHDGYLFQK
jgi:SAM-dependent methyltransferase